MSPKPDNMDIHEHADIIQRKTPPSSEFVYRKGEEPHALRRKKILTDHPEISALYGPDSKQALFALGTIFVTIGTAYFVKDWSWLPFLLVTYLVSGTANHSLMLAMHELSHDHFFQGRNANMWFSFIANLPLGLAMASSFRRYHMIHHTSLGDPNDDVDLPTKWEAQFFSNSLGRLTWLILQPFFYALRPMILKPLPVTKWEIYNWAVQLTFNGIIYYFWGFNAILYFILGTVLGTGVHPLSGHFFEHMETVVGQETYSYYGPLNFLCYNVGYHNEHHDFPKIPGSRLPQLKKKFPQYYDNLPHYNSWPRLMYDFVFKGNCNLYCRVMRKDD